MRIVPISILQLLAKHQHIGSGQDGVPNYDLLLCWHRPRERPIFEASNCRHACCYKMRTKKMLMPLNAAFALHSSKLSRSVGSLFRRFPYRASPGE